MFGLIKDVTKIVCLPVVAVSAFAEVVVKPVAEVADEMAKDIKSALK